MAGFNDNDFDQFEAQDDFNKLDDFTEDLDHFELEDIELDEEDKKHFLDINLEDDEGYGNDMNMGIDDF